ncbi:restriction endonuclease subunit S, partial [Streptomyces sp. ADI93-02]|uniref:restriction endonuclease subunit S n=2 Tax=unclassified Streptomyces TaxID=2593676 RepID=UPI000F5568EB
MSAEPDVVRWVPVGEAGEVRMGKQLSPASSQADGMHAPYLRVANVLDGRIDYSDVKTMSFSPVERQRYGLEPGDILLNEGQSLELVGRSAIYEGRPSEYCFQNTLIRFRGGADVIPAYAREVFKIWLEDGTFAAIAKKTTSIAHLGGDRFAKLPFPMAPVGQQQRIVELLDAVQQRIDVEQAALLKLENIWEGALNVELDRHLRDSEPSRLIDVSFAGGEYGSNSSASPHRMALPRYVRITDIDSKGFLSPGDSGAASIPLEVARRYILAEGDLLIARTGFTTGKSYLYRSADGLCAFAGYLVRFRIDPSVMDPEYAFLWTHGNAFRGWVSQNVREVGQRNISAREYNEHEIAHPPLEEQWKL